MTRPLPPTKLSLVTAALARGDHREALRIAAKFPELGAHKARIERGWAALTRPAFYAELGHDVDALVADGVAALRERYSLNPPAEPAAGSS